MTDIDCSSEVKSYHKVKVTLSKAQQDVMRDRRDNGRVRLENGLDSNGHPKYKDISSQGSYSMKTMVQDDENKYDIDDGVYFEPDNLKNDNKALTPLEARTRIRDALKQDKRLGTEAVIKSNCVRQEYPEGYHIDIPVYKIVKTENDNGEVATHYELASKSKWIKSDARAVTKWFNGIVGTINSGDEDGSQMRRVVKLTKKFARSRTAWKDKTTSGITITKLVTDHFYSSPNRDDKSLRETWKSMHEALNDSCEVDHPVLDSKLAEQNDTKVEFFNQKLGIALKDLNTLDETDCDVKKSRLAWDSVFNTSFFSDKPDPDTKDNSKASLLTLKSKQPTTRKDGGGRFG